MTAGEGVGHPMLPFPTYVSRFFDRFWGHFWEHFPLQSPIQNIFYGKLLATYIRTASGHNFIEICSVVLYFYNIVLILQVLAGAQFYLICILYGYLVIMLSEKVSTWFQLLLRLVLRMLPLWLYIAVVVYCTIVH